MPNLKALFHKIPAILLLAHLVLSFIFCMYVEWKTDTLGGDTLEHIHSAWLIFAHFEPYKDFFQHHNPLLWYLFAPIAGLHAKGVDDNTITSIALSSSIIISFINYYYLYLITSRFLSTKFAGLVAAAAAFTPYILLSIVHFRPDNFMMTAFFAGLYYYFYYLKEQKFGHLFLAFILFWCSFMFLQKIIFTLLLLGIITLYLIYKKKMSLADVLYACVIPLTLSLAYGMYLYANDILGVWYHSNFTFNLYIPELFVDRRIGTIWLELRILLVGATLAIIFCSKGSNVYFKILALIFVSEACQRLFYFSRFAYYFYLLVYTASILTAVFLEEKFFKRWWILTFIPGLLVHWSMYKPAIYEGNMGNPRPRFYYPLNKLVAMRTTPCDYVLNGDGIIYNLYNRDPHYYWNLLGQTDVIGAKVGIHPLMNINQVIETYKPKIINAAPYFDKYYKERGKDVLVHLPDINLINKYYTKFDNTTNLYILKPEFAPAKCDYDYSKKYYRMYD